ncbi:hypothetical protein [Schaalia odontolytica]|uniref:hypothetical protein n=1 Tax=Schaalia odontolytica TaxID=1660 RepID=UPI001CB012E0|nr:hypothetical protein [Schaalia odontolytica]MBF0960148.1 hypothetical protein [Actinomyces sp.]MCB6402846.1 hypothetical protein [Schaalia odontolytica]
MSTPYPQQPAGQPAAPAQPAQPVQQVVPQAGVPAQPAGQGYSTAPQGFAPGYAPVPQGPVKVRVNCVSLVFGICVWVFIALLVLDAWRLMHSPDVSASGAAIVGFYPLFVLGFCGPLNLVGAIVASSRAKEKPAKWKLNRLGMILNLSPYVIFFVIMFVGMIVEAFLS